MAERISRTLAMLVLSLTVSTAALAETFVLPQPGNEVVGRVTQVRVRAEETLADIARRYNIGYEEIKLANPGIDSWLPLEGTRVLLPKQFILPATPREGIVINLAEMRLYYYPEPENGEPRRVQTHPVSIGRNDWETPLGLTRVVAKNVDPSWRPTASIKADYAAQGNPLPDVIPPGPDNPLGKFALRLGLPTYLIHGTNRPFGIGMKVSRGCVRMFPEDIELLYNRVATGTEVRIINEPYKAGWLGDDLYVESHHYFDDTDLNYTPLVRSVVEAIGDRADFEVDWEKTWELAKNSRGIPFAVARKL